MVPFSFGGQDMRATPEGALLWPARSALLVADLHLEKASWFAMRGQMLPPYDSEATLSALTALVARHRPAEIWCLGDSFHDAAGCERLSPAAQGLLRALTGGVRWTWITGNHDPLAAHATAIADHCGGTIAEEAVVDGIVLRHEADPVERRPELSGHFHPKLRLVHRGRKVARRCFVASDRKMILPAFGSLTGGLDAGGEAITRAVGRGAEALIPLDDRLLRFPLAA